jgi:uncharacterized protein (DUF302 family)
MKVERGVATVASAHPYAETVQRLQDAFRARGIKVFATIDQQAEARAAGLEMPPMTLIVFGNPKAGTPLMQARPESGLDLPLKVLVSEAQPGRVSVSYNTAAYIVERHALPPQLAANLAPAEQLVAGAVA